MPDKMFLETVHSPGISHLSYIIGHRGEAAVIDPRRDGQVYLDIAQRYDCRIMHIFETHKNEDYITGSLELQRRTQAEIHHGKGLDWGFGQLVDDDDEFHLGGMILRILSTPGHTFESISIALHDTAFGDKPVAVFTGDALFIGDVGRTDFYPDQAREVAGLLYDSITQQLLPLGDHVLVYPAHGAGSVCGSGMAAREFSSLGYERQFNPSLQVADREAFIDMKVEENHYQPPYFRQMETYNKEGSAPELAELPNPQPTAPGQFAKAMQAGAQVVDIREPEAFAGGFVPGSINIPANMIPAYAGWLLDYDRDILLVASDPSNVAEVVRHFIRLGYDRVTGSLRGGVHAWETAGNRLETVEVVTARQLKEQLGTAEAPQVLDVRKIDEFEAAHLSDATHIFLGFLPDRMEDVPKHGKIVAFCGSGRRASIAASLLKRAGYDHVANNLGSMAACKSVGCELVSA